MLLHIAEAQRAARALILELPSWQRHWTVSLTKPFWSLHRGVRGCWGSGFAPGSPLTHSGAPACCAGRPTAHNAADKNECERLARLKERRAVFQVSSISSLAWLVPRLPAGKRERRRAQSADTSSPCTAQVAAGASQSLGVRAAH